MRLDHLLSKEEEVKVALLSSCQGAMRRMKAGVRSCACTGGWRVTRSGIGRTAEREIVRSTVESEGGRCMANEQLKKIPVAMRLGDTPVLIPNTKVKT